MRIKHRYAFLNHNDIKKIIEFLNKNKIKYDITNDNLLIIVEAYEDESYWNELEKIMIKHRKEPITEKVFSSKELEDAEWLRVRSRWRWEYPQPEDEYTKITYDDSSYCSSCGCGLVQQRNFLLKKSPKWGNKKFLMLNWIEDELFIPDDVKNMLLKTDLKGFNFRTVDNFKTKEILNNIHQIEIKNKLDTGMIFGSRDIVKEINCKQCGHKKVIIYGGSVLKINRNLFDESKYDIVKSNEKFGDGLMCASFIFISRKMYRLIKDNGWTKNLELEPIYLT